MHPDTLYCNHKDTLKIPSRDLAVYGKTVSIIQPATTEMIISDVEALAPLTFHPLSFLRSTSARVFSAAPTKHGGKKSSRYQFPHLSFQHAKTAREHQRLYTDEPQTFIYDAWGRVNLSASICLHNVQVSTLRSAVKRDTNVAGPPVCVRPGGFTCGPFPGRKRTHSRCLELKLHFSVSVSHLSCKRGRARSMQELPDP